MDDYALLWLVKTISDNVNGSSWNADIKERDSSALMNYRILLKEKIQFWKFCQYHFYQQWNDVKRTQIKRNLHYWRYSHLSCFGQFRCVDTS